MAAQGNVFADDSLQHFAQIRDDIIQINRLRMHHLLSAEGEQLAGQVGGPFAGGADLIEAFGDLAGEFLGFHAAQVGVATNDRQQIIKVMGDAAGKLADGFEFLGLPEIFLRFLQGFLGANTVQRAAAMSARACKVSRLCGVVGFGGIALERNEAGHGGAVANRNAQDRGGWTGGVSKRLPLVLHLVRIAFQHQLAAFLKRFRPAAKAADAGNAECALSARRQSNLSFITWVSTSVSGE